MTEAEQLEREIWEKTRQLAALRRADTPVGVPDYVFRSLDGDVALTALFGDHERLLVIHNMGQGCRYCTLWGDGLNGILPHLEDAMAVVMVSRDTPAVQRRFAQDRGWRFRMLSHEGGDYMKDQSVMEGNAPGAVVYELADGKPVRRGRTPFGPGDLYSPLWHLLALGGVGAEEFTPQFRYWSRPASLDDGGENLRD